MNTAKTQSAIHASNKVYIQLKNLKSGGSAAFLTKEDCANLGNVIRESSAAGVNGGVAIFFNEAQRTANGETFTNKSLSICPATGTPKAK